MRGLSPLSIMSLRPVRAAAEAGAGIAALDTALGEILWANGAAKTLLGLSGLPGELAAATPQGRQIRAAARLVAARGEARILLRPATGLAARPVAADLRTTETQNGSIVLLTVPGLRPSEISDAAHAQRLLGDSASQDAAVYGAQGLLAAASGFQAEAAAVPLEALAAFIASDEERDVTEHGGRRMALTRVASRLVLVEIEEALPAAAGQDEKPLAAGAPGRAAGFFSVKRQKLPAGRSAVSMSALVQRWHQRLEEDAGSGDKPFTHSEQESPPENAGLAQDERDEAEGTVPVALDSEPPADVALPESPPAPARLRSRWDVPEKASLAQPAERTTSAEDMSIAEQAPPRGDAARSGDEASPVTARDTGDAGREPEEPAVPFPVPEPDVPVEAGAKPGPGEPAVRETPVAVPSDAHVGTEGETAQPTETESAVILPDVHPDDAAGLETPISDDAEAPGNEALLPQDASEPTVSPEEPADTGPGTALSPGAADGDADGRAAPDRVLPAEPEAGGPPDLSSDDQAGTEPAPAERMPAERFDPRFDVAPVRFVWQIDRNGKFHALSDEFAAAVGPKAAAVVGLSFREVANVFGFDTDGEIAKLLDRRDTWSGRSILWPVEASDRKVPVEAAIARIDRQRRKIDVDLAALPVYARDRSFDGFRGFGIVKMNEAIVDEDAVGLLLAGDDPSIGAEQVPEAGAGQPEPTASGPSERSFLRTFEVDLPGVTFGRRQEPPRAEGSHAADGDADASAAGSNDDGEPKVIRLEERRRPRDGVLSQAEEAAFRAIGMKLNQQSEPERSGALRLADRAADDGLAARQADLVDPDGETETAGTDGAATESPEPTAVDAAETAGRSLLDPAAPAPDRTSAPGGASLARVDKHDETPMGLASIAAADSAAQQDDTQRSDSAAARLEEGATDLEGAGAENAAAFVGSSRPADEALPEPLPPATAGEPEEEDPAEQVLDRAAAKAELEAIFGSLPLPVLIQMRETLVYANREFEDLSGYGALADLEAAGGLDALFVEREEGLRSGELAIRRSNGQILDVRVHMQRVTLSGRSSLLMSFAPSPRDSAAAAQPPEAERPEADAAARREIDDLKQEIEELQAVLDTATDGVVLLDPAGTIRAMNGSAHALFGGGLEEHAGRHLASLFAHESQKATHDYLDMLRDDGLAGILNDGREVIGRVAQGGFIPLFITIGRLSGERGWCVVMRDIAHWKRIEEDLVNARRQAEAASLHKSRFLANVSHELRTPLNAIIGFADVMASECFGPIGNERYLEYLGDIKRSGHHVLDLVNDLLDISKIEAGKMDLAFEAVSLNEVVSEVVSLMQPQANRERVIVRSNLPSSVPPVVADRRTMRQIALNLVANAIRFTPAGGQIIASTTYTVEGDVLLRVRDSGIGMTEREIEIALTPFQQVHAPSVTRGEGTGLGLPLTKAMVEANRAAFAINSVPGEGTLVEIAFPSQRVLAD